MRKPRYEVAGLSLDTYFVIGLRLLSMCISFMYLDYVV